MELIWASLNLNGDSRVGFGVTRLAFGWPRCLQWECWCALGSVHASRGLIDNWCMPVVLGLLIDGDWFWCPLSFLVLVELPFCRWPGCSGVKMECIQCGCLWLGVYAGMSII